VFTRAADFVPAARAGSATGECVLRRARDARLTSTSPPSRGTLSRQPMATTEPATGCGCCAAAVSTALCASAAPSGAASTVGAGAAGAATAGTAAAGTAAAGTAVSDTAAAAATDAAGIAAGATAAAGTAADAVAAAAPPGGGCGCGSARRVNRAVCKSPSALPPGKSTTTKKV
jgi:hypothetical protein